MLDRDCARRRQKSAVGTEKPPRVKQKNIRNAINDFAELDRHN
jgi:hypothetical protein